MEACFTFADEIPGAHWTNVRNRALIATLYRTGLRVSEALDLRPLDLDLHHALIRVRRGKGGRSRAVGIDPGGTAELQRWLNLRDVLGFGVDDAVFCTTTGRAISPAYVRRPCPRSPHAPASHAVSTPTPCATPTSPSCASKGSTSA